MRACLRLTLLALLGLIAGAVFVAEGALHIWHKEQPDDRQASAIAGADDAAWRAIQARAADGVTLSAWLFTPRRPNGACVIALHGVGDTRVGMLGHVDFLLRAGYTVLAPDCRGHGASGGELISYGVRERDDIAAWESVLLATPGVERIYGIGQSMGAAILLQSLAHGNRLRALVADCPFATFQEIAYQRLDQQGVLGELASRPLVNLGFVYARARYGLNLWDASPVDALRATRVPVLLIHGTRDTNIVLRHSRELHAANPAAAQLWEVPGAGHVASLATAHAEYIRRVDSWFDDHR
jgi:uncharacterized protein